MADNTVIVTFSRDGERDGVLLSKDREYRARVDNGPPSTFRSPWDQTELEVIIDDLRNKGDQKPTEDYLKNIGIQLGDRLHQIDGLQKSLCAGDATIHLQLDYPELARLPWEIAAAKEFPQHHLLQEGVKFVRQVPCKRLDKPAEWPSGRDESLRLLYMWGEGAAGKVPHAEHHEALKEVCAHHDIELEAREMTDLDSVTEVSKKGGFHFVHLLAHGAISGRDWGLALKNGAVTGGQLARALTAGHSTPALVSVAACDSANNRDNSFGSVAFEMHASGIPFVHASQFRLRKTVSIETVRELYRGVLGGKEPLGVVHDIKRQLAPRPNEGWVNEVVYCRYRRESLADFFTIARQQAALRRARLISKREFADEKEKEAGLKDLKHEKESLLTLVELLKGAKSRDPAAIAETYGLLGSIERRMAEILKSPPAHEDLRVARKYYESGFAADANSHYCGINVIHLSLQVDEDKEAKKWMPMIARIAKNQADSDFWSWATAGDVEVYAGNAEEAKKFYREFVQRAELIRDSKVICKNLESSLKQLDRIRRQFEQTHPEIDNAAKAAIGVLKSAIDRHSA